MAGGYLNLLMVVVLNCFLLFECGTNKGKIAHDEHGRVKMGVSNSMCDTAKLNLTVDYDGSKTAYSCTEDGDQTIPVGNKEISKATCSSKSGPPDHKCMNESITYDDDIPTSGPHRPLWPKYGEYKYCPPQRWLHALEHGAIVLLYHPCADKKTVKQFKDLVKGCLRRHIITPYRKVGTSKPFALLSWRCKVRMDHFDVDAAADFIMNHALKGREAVPMDGQFDQHLVQHAQVVTDSDESDTKLCPHYRPKPVLPGIESVCLDPNNLPSQNKLPAYQPGFNKAWNKVLRPPNKAPKYKVPKYNLPKYKVPNYKGNVPNPVWYTNLRRYRKAASGA